MSNQTLSTKEPSEQLQAEEDSSATLCSRLLDSVICGDNCEVMRQWPDECVDLAVTSPPYDDLRTYGGHEWDFYGVAWNLARILKPGGVIAWVVMDQTKDGGETGTSMRQALHFQALGLNLADTMVYQKQNYLPQNAPARYDQTWEYLFILTKGKAKAGNMLKDRRNAKAGQTLVTAGSRAKSGETVKGKKLVSAEMGLRGNVWSYPVGGYDNGHPAPFPESLAKDCVWTWSNPGDIVLDPFAGSGTTLKAAKELNRRYVGIEVNPEYVKICEERTMQESLPLYCENA